jgi:hypothetical protein
MVEMRRAGGCAEAARRIALRIGVDEQHTLLERPQRRGKVDRGRRLADAALLVGDGENPPRHGRTP